jgi:pimeloyl-ACP methyl ester carboxylesterase
MQTTATHRVETTTAALLGFAYDCRTRRHPSPATAPVVLLGGAFQHKTAWGRLETALARTASVVTVDLPGWGSADLLPAWHGLDFLAEALHRVLIAAGHHTVHVFGGSYGGAIALRFAQTYPEQVLTLALMGTSARLPETVCDRLGHILELLRAGRVPEFADYAVDLLLSPTAEIKRGPAVRRILRTLFRTVTPEDMAKFEQNTLRLMNRPPFTPAPALPMPVLLGTGEHDLFTPPALCRELATHCADARFALLRDADHVIHLEVPDELADLLTRFHTGWYPRRTSPPGPERHRRAAPPLVTRAAAHDATPSANTP